MLQSDSHTNLIFLYTYILDINFSVATFIKDQKYAGGAAKTVSYCNRALYLCMLI